MKIALATLRFCSEHEEAHRCVPDSLEDGAHQCAKLVCTPECFLPGLRGVGVIIGGERVTRHGLLASAMIVAPNGRLLGWQDKVQIDPSKEGIMHEKAALCRAAENSIYFATVNYAIPDCIAGNAVIDPDGTLVAMHSDSSEIVLVCDIDLTCATGRFAQRLAVAEYP